MGGFGLLQANVARSPGAQDLLMQALAEGGYTLTVVAEPSRVPPNHPSWLGGRRDRTIAIYWRSWQGAPTTTALERGDRHVIMQWGPIAVVGVYLRPTKNLAHFEDWLSDIERSVRRLSPKPVLVAGDFNAWSTAWGSRRTNSKGEVLERWAAALGLVLLNQGRVSTCVRREGRSIIDLTWATPSAARLVTLWRVMRDTENLSDHRYISVELGVLASLGRRRESRPRWAIKRLREDALMASIEAACWVRGTFPETHETDPLQEAEWIGATLTAACNAAMPRSKTRPRRAVHWWTDEIADLRRRAVLQRRRFARCRRRGEQAAGENEGYLAAKAALRKAIKVAKGRAWTEFLNFLGRSVGAPLQNGTWETEDMGAPANGAAGRGIRPKGGTDPFPRRHRGGRGTALIAGGRLPRLGRFPRHPAGGTPEGRQEGPQGQHSPGS
ncbi:PREDICTED: uncharacterized protein LOC105557067 [Vollenhovia emeryi]|uniref:uncharacterized protein LOC105557067 n=1 Tax=Vollenhovia emeryi TaxID=411798 RepID=UPI0005F37418|nr:PREDICTED: uncharacterized protein LOC105557067 [Vollenhovia emeryi]